MRVLLPRTAILAHIVDAVVLPEVLAHHANISRVANKGEVLDMRHLMDHHAPEDRLRVVHQVAILVVGKLHINQIAVELLCYGVCGQLDLKLLKGKLRDLLDGALDLSDVVLWLWQQVLNHFQGRLRPDEDDHVFGLRKVLSALQNILSQRQYLAIVVVQLQFIEVASVIDGRCLFRCFKN